MLTPRHLEHLGGALKDLRRASGSTQAEICSRTGLKSPQLSRWENGRDVPTLESLIRYLGAIGASLADLERILLGDEEQKRGAAITQVLREIDADHGRYIRSGFEVQLAFKRLSRPNPDGLERRWLHLLAEEPEPYGALLAASPEDGAAAVAAVAELPDLEALLVKLPATLDELLNDDRYRQPAVVESLIKRGWSLLTRRDEGAIHVADAARLLAGELPPGSNPGSCFGLRARSLELWGMAMLAEGEPATAEAALLGGFKLLAQTPGADPADLAAILGRLTAVAGDRGHGEDLERYAGEAVRVVLASDPEWPMAAFARLWQAVTSVLHAQESIERASGAVFETMWKADESFKDRMVGLALETVEEAGDGATRKLQELLSSDLASWKEE